MKRQITKAVIAAAGYGTRFLPATKVQPKEMLPLIDKPVIQHLVEEAVASGIKEVIIVTRAGQHIMEDHFDSSFELETQLENNHKVQLLEKIRQIPRMAKFIYLRQTKDYPYGNASPLLVARPLIEKGEHFVYMFGDDLIKSKVPGIKQLINIWRKNPDALIAFCQFVTRAEIGRLSSVKIKKGTVNQIESIIEKPVPGKAPSLLNACARFILNEDFLKTVQKQKLGKDNELWLMDCLNSYAKNKKILAASIDGKWMTMGDPLNYLKTMVEFALEREDIGSQFLTYLKDKINRKP